MRAAACRASGVMVRVHLEVAICLATAAAFAPAGPRAGEPAHHPPEVTMLDSTSVALPMDLSTRRPIIELSVNGHGPYRFILDTGAGGTVIDASLARELSLPVVGQDTLGDPANPNAFQVDRVRADSVTLRGLRLEGVVMAAFDVRKMMGQSTSGVLGLPDLADLLVTLDYPAGRLLLSRGALGPDDPAAAEYESPDGIISIPILVNGVPFNAHLDSGNPGGFMLPRARAGEIAFKSPPIEIGKAGTVSGMVPIWGAELDGEIRVVGVSFRDPEVHLSDLLDRWANVGFDALRELRVTIDQRNHRLRLERTGTSDGSRMPPARRRVGLMLGGQAVQGGFPIVDGGLRIEKVIEGSLAESSGLKAGDSIISIDSRAVSDYAPGELMDLFGGFKPLQLTVRRAEEEISIRID